MVLILKRRCTIFNTSLKAMEETQHFITLLQMLTDLIMSGKARYRERFINKHTLTFCKVPSMRLNDPQTGKVIAEVRMRRDAGELNVLVDVLYPSEADYPYFPLSNSSYATMINKTFGNTAGKLFSRLYTSINAQIGFEIMLGPTPNGRTSPMGDTRIFLTGIASSLGRGAITGYALAVKPGAAPIYNSTDFYPLNQYGNYSGNTSNRLDYSNIILGVITKRTYNFSEMITIAGAVVGIMPRTDNLGYRLEATIPMALFPEFCSVQVRVSKS